jgi:WD40 repeat protein
MTAAYSPDGKYLLTGHQSGAIVIWDPTAMRPLYGFQAHQDKKRKADPTAFGLRFSPDGKRLASMTRSGEVRFWDTAKLLAEAAGR